MDSKSVFSKKDIFWNALGSFVYAMASMILSFAVLRISGPRDGGIFAFGFSTLGQQLFILAYFGIRPYHVTDLSRKYSFGDYLFLRKLTSVLAVIGALSFISIMLSRGDYDTYKARSLFLLSLYKILDGYADVYESELQRQNLLYLTGQSLCFRTLLSVFSLLITLILSHNLFLSALVSDIAGVLGIRLFAINKLCSKNKTNDNNINVIWERYAKNTEFISLIKQTLPLCFSVFLDFYVFSASKYATDKTLGSEAIGIFNILFMPASLIYLFANFLIRPSLPGLAKAWEEKDIPVFTSRCRFLMLSVGILCLVIFSGAFIFGRWGLQIFELMIGERYKGQLTERFVPFLLLILGGGLYALANVQYYILITMRKIKGIFFIYLIAALISLITADLTAKAYGMPGGSLHYLMMMGILFLSFSVYSRINLKASSK